MVTKFSLKPNANEYQLMFSTMVIDETKRGEINAALNKIKAGKDVYEKIAQKVNPKIPYYAIGIAHCMECYCDFTKHIHCGDPLTKRTVNEPKGRPIAEPLAGQGEPYTFEESCIDWLNMKGWNKWQDWGISDILARLELNNGTGYRKLFIPTPYLWSYTNYYGQAPYIGKYVSDGVFKKYDDKGKPIVSKQVGAAILLYELTK